MHKERIFDLNFEQRQAVLEVIFSETSKVRKSEAKSCSLYYMTENPSNRKVKALMTSGTPLFAGETIIAIDTRRQSPYSSVISFSTTLRWLRKRI